MITASIIGHHSFFTEKRKEKRYMQHRRCLTACVNGETYSVKIRNISAWGGSCQGLHDAKVGARVVLNFEGDGSVVGRIQWAQGDVCGIRFLTPISAERVFFNQRAQGERARRVEVSRPATVVVGDATRRAIIRNVSEGGMMLETFCHLRTGQTINIVAGSFRGEGTVRWSTGTHAGVLLATPLRLELFEKQSIASPLGLVQPVVGIAHVAGEGHHG